MAMFNVDRAQVVSDVAPHVASKGFLDDSDLNTTTNGDMKGDQWDVTM